MQANPQCDRRQFLKATSCYAAAIAVPTVFPQHTDANEAKTPMIVDTHMHVWANEPQRYPFPHPYSSEFKEPEHPGTVEMLIDDMDEYGCTHAVLVQVIFHGWDNTYIADCVKRYPDRLRAHGLIDPTDPNVADKLEYWMKEHGLHGMRFSPIYYQNGTHGGAAWLNADATHTLGKTAEELEAVFNFFISPPQLPKLETMVKAHPDVRIIIDHYSQMDFAVADPEPDFRRLLHMAKYPNVWVKITELSSVSKSKTYPFEDAYPYVKRVYEAFGPDRLLFGTGYPGSAREAYNRPTLGEEISLIRDKMPFFSNDDTAKILGLNAAALWNLSPLV